MTANEVMRAANTGKCVVWLSGRNMPAAFLIGMPFRVVMNALPKLKTYKKKKDSNDRPH